MFKIFFVFILFFGIVTACVSNNNIVKVGIYDNQEPVSILINLHSGGYDIIADGILVDSITNKKKKISITSTSGKVSLKIDTRKVGVYKNIYLKKKTWGSVFYLQPILPKKYQHQYQDDLIVTAKGNRLRLINSVYVEHYVAGVVESESGAGNNPEYYKVQSIICRTYFLSNKRRHAKEGFNVCDKVHCQVYHGKSRFNKEIPKAAKITKGIVIVDYDINLITSAFHSNCGGQTINSEDGWKKPLPYLKSVCDTFCTDMPHAYWTKSIPRSNWLHYLEKKYDYKIYDSLRYNCAFEHLPENRERLFNYLDSNLTTAKIRFDWKLRSAHFYATETCDSILFRGNGFGHGIGLCQEGAMKMSESGFSYNEILHFYYTDVHLIELKNIDFFRD